VLAQIGTGFAEAPKVDDAAHAGRPRSFGECQREAAVLCSVLRSGRSHGVNQVKCRVTPFEIPGQRLGIFKIRLSNLNAGILSP
jgi:hypothetical protein